MQFLNILFICFLLSLCSIAIADSSICRPINKIEINGGSSFFLTDTDKIRDKYEKKCLYAKDINNIVREITNKYISSGYITSRIILPEQDLNSGILTLEVKEGYVEEVIYKNQKGNRNHVLPISDNKILNLRDIEQSIDQLNRLKSNKVKLQITPGKKPGSSIIVVDSEPAKKWYLTSGIDNSGSKHQGITQNFTTITLEDLFHSNELYSFGTRRSLGSSRSGYSRSYSGLISVPFGYHNITFSSSYGSSRNYIKAYRQSFRNKSNSITKKISLDSVLHRDGKSKTIHSIGFAHDNYSNYIADNKIEISSYKLDKYDIGISHQRRLKQSILSGNINYTHGINKSYKPGFGSIMLPHKKFNKFEYNLTWIKPLPTKPAYVFPKFSMSLNGQHSPDILCGSEKIAIGGLHSVRGFKEKIENSDNGAYLRNELSLGIPQVKSAHSISIIEEPEFYLAYDIGKFYNQEEFGDIKGTMSGGTVGLRNISGIIKFDLALSKALSSKYIEKRPYEFYFSFSLSV